MAHRLAGSEPTPAQAFDDSHLDDDVQAALKALPPEYRAAVVLCDIEGFSYEEIAATLGVKLGTVRSRIHRGRAQAALRAGAPQARTGRRRRRPSRRPGGEHNSKRRSKHSKHSRRRGKHGTHLSRQRGHPGPGAPSPGPGPAAADAGG